VRTCQRAGIAGGNCASAPGLERLARNHRGDVLPLASKFAQVDDLDIGLFAAGLRPWPGPMTRTHSPGHFRHLLGPVGRGKHAARFDVGKELRRILCSPRAVAARPGSRVAKAGPRPFLQTQTRTKRAKTVWARRPSDRAAWRAGVFALIKATA